MHFKEETCKDIAKSVLDKLFLDPRIYQDTMHRVWESVDTNYLSSQIIEEFLIDHQGGSFFRKMLLRAEKAMQHTLLEYYEDLRKSHMDVILDWHEVKQWLY